MYLSYYIKKIKLCNLKEWLRDNWVRIVKINWINVKLTKSKMNILDKRWKKQMNIRNIILCSVHLCFLLKWLKYNMICIIYIQNLNLKLKIIIFSITRIWSWIYERGKFNINCSQISILIFFSVGISKNLKTGIKSPKLEDDKNFFFFIQMH